MQTRNIQISYNNRISQCRSAFKLILPMWLDLQTSIRMKLSSINNSLDAYQYLKNRLKSPVEEIWVVCLHSNNKVIRSRCIFRGSVNFCNYHARDIFRYTCLNNASKFILAHNHPSGESSPSCKDIEMTKKINQISKIIDIPLIDHIICTKKSYYSFADNGWI